MTAAASTAAFTIRALARHSAVPFVTSLGVGAHLQAWGVAAERITELDWWESHRVPHTGLTITAAPSQHFSGRGFKDRNATLWSSMVVQSEQHRVFFSGDTGLTSEYAAIREHFGPFDLVMLEVGAFHPAWGDIHLGPENALKALQHLGGGSSSALGNFGGIGDLGLDNLQIENSLGTLLQQLQGGGTGGTVVPYMSPSLQQGNGTLPFGGSSSQPPGLTLPAPPR